VTTPSPHFFRHYPEARFGGFSDVDGTIRFYLRVNALIGRDDTILDIGCGRGEYYDDLVAIRRDLRILKGRCGRVIGIDPDPRAAANPCLDEFRQIVGAHWPIQDRSVHLAIADFVLEHVADPASFISEARRVLRPGGYLCLRTPNANSYFGVFSRLLPHDGWVARLVGRGEIETFPTFYRCNTRRKLHNLVSAHGFRSSIVFVESEPAYLDFHWMAYAIGVLHQRYAPQWLRLGLLAFAQRDDDGWPDTPSKN
jgi:SAM-dependent methyltransferase